MKSSILWWVQRKARRKFDWKFSDFSGRTRGVSGRFQTVASGSALPRHSVAPPLHKMFSDLKNHVKIFWLFFTFSENWSYGTGRDGTGRDGTGRDGTGRDGTGRDGTEGCGTRDGTGQKAAGRGTGRDWSLKMRRDGTGRDGTVGLRDAGRDGTPLSSSRGALIQSINGCPPLSSLFDLSILFLSLSSVSLPPSRFRWYICGVCVVPSGLSSPSE